MNSSDPESVYTDILCRIVVFTGETYRSGTYKKIITGITRLKYKVLNVIKCLLLHPPCEDI